MDASQRTDGMETSKSDTERYTLACPGRAAFVHARTRAAQELRPFMAHAHTAFIPSEQSGLRVRFQVRARVHVRVGMRSTAAHE
eukprot:5611631-Pleurochrysis_carterae.AAC.1